MKIISISCNLLIITLVILLVCYVFGSLMCANFDITAWNPDIRVPLFGVGLIFTMILNVIYIVDKMN